MLERRPSHGGEIVNPNPPTLLGTVHGDPAGFAKLSRFLSRFRPDLLLVELSPYGRAFRARNGKALATLLSRRLKLAAARSGIPYRRALKHPRIRSIRRQLALPYEYRAARRYARRHGVPLVLVDDSAFSRRCIARWAELLAVDNLATLLALPEDEPDAEALYAKALQRLRSQHPSFRGIASRSRQDQNPAWNRRERWLVEEACKAMEAFGPRRPLRIGGWEHLVELCRSDHANFPEKQDIPTPPEAGPGLFLLHGDGLCRSDHAKPPKKQPFPERGEKG